MGEIHYEFADYGKGSDFYESLVAVQRHAAEGDNVRGELALLRGKLEASPDPGRTRPAAMLLARAESDPDDAVKLIGRALIELAPLNSVGRIEAEPDDA
ncbi:hypothetical protein [Miltoncostaea marina]|uniref:hypothetical protein n=1 Tax=Miltoncostaea marina TaxID=2843215 RepID=UPI001C3CDD75|nr:hypothetical protein [Miltoncostaea marina]